MYSIPSLLTLMCLRSLQALPVILDSSPAPFALELAAVAASKELLNLEKWLGERLSRDVASSAAFLQSVITFLDVKSQVHKGKGGQALVGRRRRSGTTDASDKIALAAAPDSA